MNNEEMVRARRLHDGSIVQVLPDGSIRPFTRRSEWTGVVAMTEEDFKANAVADPDNPPLTATYPANMRRLSGSG